MIAANDFLLERVAALNPNAIKIPTVVDLGAYDPAGVKKFPRFTVGWIGTPVTYSYLEQAAGALRTMSRAADFELLVIARRDLEAVRSRACGCVLPTGPPTRKPDCCCSAMPGSCR